MPSAWDMPCSHCDIQQCPPVDDGVHQHLDGVAVCQQVNDVKGVLYDADLQGYSRAQSATMCRFLVNLLEDYLARSPLDTEFQFTGLPGELWSGPAHLSMTEALVWCGCHAKRLQDFPRSRHSFSHKTAVGYHSGCSKADCCSCHAMPGCQSSLMGQHSPLAVSCHCCDRAS